MRLEAARDQRAGFRMTAKASFAAAAAMMAALFSPCLHGAPHLESSMSSRHEAVAAIIHDRRLSACGTDIRSALDMGERMASHRCTESYTFVLTNTSVLVFPRGQAGSAVDSSVRFSHMRNRIGSIIADGIVDWSATDSAAFLVLRNRSLVVLPLKREETGLPTYSLGFDTARMGKGRMLPFKDIVFIASPSGRIFAVSYTDRAIMRSVRTGMESPDANLFVADGRLFYGNQDGNDVEIKVEGPGSISLAD